MAESDPVVFIVDDDAGVREGLGMLLESAGYRVIACPSAESFFQHYDHDAPCCLVLDLQMPVTGGLELQEILAARGQHPPIIFLTGHGDVPAAVKALKQGAVDFFQKPLADEQGFLDRVRYSIRLASDARDLAARKSEIQKRLAVLTPRERQVMEQICAGKANKVIAIEFGISERTVELHRSRMMRKLGVRSVAELMRAREGA